MSDKERQAEASRILRRLEQEAEKTVNGFRRSRSVPDEWTERWGRRVGLVVGYLLAALLLAHLISTYVIQ